MPTKVVPTVAQSGPRKVKRHRAKKQNPEPTSPLGVLLNHEIPQICKEHNLTLEQVSNPLNKVLNDSELRKKYNRVVESVEILKYSSNGEGLALLPHPEIPGGKQIAVVPFGMPGDVVTLRVFMTKHTHVDTDLLSIDKSSDLRKQDLIRCRYFGACSGCQYQPIEYEQQLEFKRNTIVNAYKYFAPRLGVLGKLPEVGKTVASPLKYGYRTKLTPHYQLSRHEDAKTRPNFGFGSKGRPSWREVPLREYPGEVMDIEDCIIGTEIVRQGMKNERARLESQAAKGEIKHKGATVLLREDTRRNKDEVKGSTDEMGKLSILEQDDKFKTCVTDNNAIVSEYVNGLRFDFVANEFFQNNNSILPKVIDYVKSNLALDKSGDDYLVDAYCGSGLFSISCASSVRKSLGVEISAHSIAFAKKNVELNNIDNCEFIEGKAEKLFEKIDFPKDKTSVILDPPRKGCDEVFLKQLAEFYPKRIVYVSCNVHSQARDVEYFLTETEKGKDYTLESIIGFDFFPQTHHVEGVAVLSRKC
ncbi:hypothetical protein OGAPHI_005544 [Ogataea philodendri]|uniref:TRAM domain-containing protein n=1 Tax=Ogataea philodendri TaxID=1378263 RepID=A0A9P8P093_9ASCO|nr:uncharacterized protein OGAPHI_005544 [Ogataea philodendri]KAH3662294.1 hypothetical protein OGAPHI_005544 [Ogataea philodendri]